MIQYETYNSKCIKNVLIIDFVALLDEISIRFAQHSLIPANREFLKDNSSETRTNIESSHDSIGLQHIQIPIKTFPIDVGDINITITGSNLGCGHNLLVSQLKPAQSQNWIGRWTACQLEERGTFGLRDSCSYLCKPTGYCKETQILNVPQHLYESFLEICQLRSHLVSSSRVY